MAFMAKRLPAHRSTRCVMARVRALLLLMTYRSGERYDRRLCQRLDDLHLGATLRASRLPFVVVGSDRVALWWDRRRGGVLGCGPGLLLGSRRQQLADAGEFGLPISVGKKAVVPYALEAVGQNVKEKAAHELGRREGHELEARAVDVILPGKGAPSVGDFDEPMVGDSDAVRIAAQVAQNLLGPGKGLLAVDHPIGLPEWSKVGRKGTLRRQVGEIGEELQVPILVGGKKLPKKHAPEQA